MKKEVMLLVLVMVLSASLVAADFSVDNYSIETIYGPRDNIRGWINISFDEEPGDSILEAGGDFEGEIELMDFLDANLVYYECIPDDCEHDYSSSSGTNSKTFSLGYKDEKAYGFVLQGSNIEVTGLKFNVSTTNAPTCSNPLEIDILDDDLVEWKSDNIGVSYTCKEGQGTGCFNISDVNGEVSIGETPFCERVSLSSTKKFELGAWVKKGTKTWYNGLLLMSLYNKYGEELISCELPQPNTSGEEISCKEEYDEQELDQKINDYYVCLYAEEATDYTIKKEDKDACGFYAFPGDETEYHDYYIFARGAKFNNIGSFSFNQQEYEDQGNTGDLSEYLTDYIINRYNGDCTDKCVIPVKFRAYTDLGITISKLELRYSTGAGPIATPETKIYDTEKISAKITSDFEVLDLEYSNITVPDDYDEHDLMLYLAGEELLDDEIEIEIRKIPQIKGVFPKKAAAAVPTRFVAIVDSPSGVNISEYKWDFGDGTEEVISFENGVIFTYDDIGIYDLTLEVEDESGFIGKKTFEITVGSPKSIVESTLEDYSDRLDNITSQITLMPTWYKGKVEEIIDLDNLASELNALKRKNEAGPTSDEYIEIMEELLVLYMPSSVEMAGQGGLPYFVDIEDINVDYFSDMGAGSYDAVDEQAYQEAIGSWTETNLNLVLNFKYIVANYDDSTEVILGVFTLNINAKNEVDELYGVINEIDAIFKEDYKNKDIDGGTGIRLDDFTSKSVEFAVPYADVESLVMYFSPRFSQLEVVESIIECDNDGKCESGETTGNCPNDCKPWGWVAILLIILFFLGLFAYLMLQFWYKKKYEGHLFKTKNDLFNIVNFIKNAENQGMTDSDTKSALRKAGWNGEQIRYAFKKIRGKAIMPLDFLKLFSRFQRKKLDERPVSGSYMPPGTYRGPNFK